MNSRSPGGQDNEVRNSPGKGRTEAPGRVGLKPSEPPTFGVAVQGCKLRLLTRYAKQGNVGLGHRHLIIKLKYIYDRIIKVSNKTNHGIATRIICSQCRCHAYGTGAYENHLITGRLAIVTTGDETYRSSHTETNQKRKKQ